MSDASDSFHHQGLPAARHVHYVSAASAPPAFDVLPPPSRLLSFNGRIGRTNYLIAQIFLLIAIAIAAGVAISIRTYGLQNVLTIATPLVHHHSQQSFSAALEQVGSGDEVLVPLIVLAVIIWFLLSLTINARRCHDFGRSGWIMVPIGLVGLVPYVGWLASLIPLFVPGNPYSNEYGDPPEVSHFWSRVGRLPQHLWRGETPITNFLFYYVLFLNFLVLDKAASVLIDDSHLQTVALVYVAAVLMFNAFLIVGLWRCAANSTGAARRFAGRLVAVLLAARVAFTLASLLAGAPIV